MFGRITNAATAQANGSSASGSRPKGGGNGGNGGGNGSERNIAGSALRRAGLIDDDAAMRTASSSGPNRRRGGGSGRGSAVRGSGADLVGPSRGEANQGPASKNSARNARDRANPLAGRMSRKPVATTTSTEAAVKGQAFSIRGAATGVRRPQGVPPKRQGRIPGGDDEPAPAFNTQSTIALLKRFLASRWNGEAKFLNLENLAADPVLKDAKVAPPGQPGAHKDIGTVIFKLASEIYPDLITISLAQNNFKTLVPVMQLPQYLPDLQNLSLENNDLKWTKDLATFALTSKAKLKSLRELILLGNPMQTNAASALNEEGYRAEVLAKFPTLTLLDRVQVSQKETAVAHLPSGKAKPDQILNADTPTRNFPLQVKPGFSDEAANGIVPGFLHKFFTLFDTARESQELQAVYASNATWSLILVRTPTPRAKSAGYLHAPDMPRQRDLNWHPYKSFVDHNIMALGTRPSSKGIPVGAAPIMATIKRFPATTHPLTEPSKFVVDSWLLPNAMVGALAGTKEGSQPQRLDKPDAVLFISVKGEFAEGPSYGVRSFDRTFIVAPSGPASAAAKAGWPCTILAEQLTIRNYCGIDGWKPDTLPLEANLETAPPLNGNSAVVGAPPAPTNAEEAQQHALALQFASETGLTYPFAVQCLQENSWQPQPAMAVFQSLRSAGTIPAEAFSAGVVPAR